MHNHKSFLPLIAATLLIGITSGMLVHAQKGVVPGRVPPPGDYECSKSTWVVSYGSFNLDGTPMMIVQDIPSVMGTLHLDGKGGYLSHKKPGRYRFNAAKREFAFVSGPLAGWPVVYEVAHGTATLRLAATKKDKVLAHSRIGEHACSLNSGVKFPDSPPPASVGGPDLSGGPVVRNNGARGVLTFKREWGSDNKIVDLNLASGAIQSRFEGTDPFSNSKGETAFVNKSGALVIANAEGVATSTIPVPEGLDRPDSVVMSPDGSRIAFHVAPTYSDSRVLVASRAGQIVAQFKDVTEPNWTPDGRLLVAKITIAEGAQPALFLSDVQLKQLNRIDPNLDSASQPAASPDGRRIAFVQHGHIWLMNLDGSGLKQLSFSADSERNPSWSPDGKWIVASNKNDGVVLLISLQNGKITEVRSKDDRRLQSRGHLNWH